LPWKQILKRNVRLEVRVTSTKSKLYHTAAIRERVIAGIYEALGYDIPSRFEKSIPDEMGEDDDGDLVLLDVRLVNDQVDISINTSQTPLHQRGYRLQTAKAPLREDLAYAMLWSSGLTPLYHDVQKEGQPTRRYEALLDPFCGSGTIAIEAAAMMAGMPPGRLRPTPLVGTSLENRKKWSLLIQRSSSDKGSETPHITVAASDRDSGAVEATKSNAERAGVLDFMHVQQSALSSHPWLETPDHAPRTILIATNPPFGKRVSPSRSTGKESYLLPLYQTLGHRIHRLVDNGRHVGAVVLANGPDLVRRVGLPFEKIFQSTHGGMAVAAMYYRAKSK
jgi:putative N6-adenine-specific DNA methylase